MYRHAINITPRQKLASFEVQVSAPPTPCNKSKDAAKRGLFDEGSFLCGIIKAQGVQCEREKIAAHCASSF